MLAVGGWAQAPAESGVEFEAKIPELKAIAADPQVIDPLSEYLEAKRNADGSIAKIFVSDANGLNVGFDARTAHWTHK
jgi:hypothetical protein